MNSACPPRRRGGGRGVPGRWTAWVAILGAWAGIPCFTACGAVEPNAQLGRPGDDPMCTTNVMPSSGSVPEGTQRMAARLAAIREATRRDETLNPVVFQDAARATRLRREIDAARAAGNDARVMALRPLLARHLLNAGREEEALRELQLHRRQVMAGTSRLDAQQSAALAMQTAVSLFRIGERDNCVAGPNAESCLFPLQGGGVHQWTRGARGAMEVLLRHLKEQPGDRQALWWLNLAGMALGEFPRDLPPRWRLDAALFQSEAPFPRFTNVVAGSGLDGRGLAGGVVCDDFDGDGWEDVVVSTSSLEEPLRYFRGVGGGSFQEASAEAGFAGLNGGLNLVHADYDNDGLPDLFVLRGGWWGAQGRHPNSLLRNLGGGRFEDVTEQAGVLSFHPTQTAVWWDFDGDGWLDLFVGNESTLGEEHPCELYWNRGDGTFAECAAAAGLAVTAFIKGATSADYDRDGRPDLFLSNGHGANLLYRNLGPRVPEGRGSAARPPEWRFEEVASAAGVLEPERSFTTWFWDFDEDGWPDLYVGGYGYRDVGDMAADYLKEEHGAEFPRLYRNRRDGTFEEISASAGVRRVLLGMGGNYADVDGDGWLDFYLGTGDPELSTLVPNRFFRGDGGQRFQDVTSAAGVGHLQKGHGVAFADVDHDGDLDLLHVLGGALPSDAYHRALFRNPGFGTRWLRLKLEGVRSNRSGIGAIVRVTVEVPGGRRTVSRTVGTGGSFGGNPLALHFGLGEATGIERVEIEWPAAARTQQVSGLELDRAYRVWEGETRAERME